MNIRAFMVVTAIFMVTFLSLPALAGTPIPSDYARMYVNTEVSGEASVNETVSLLWSPGTGESYEWKQSDSFVNPQDYTSTSRFTMEIINNSTSWDYARWNNTRDPSTPGSWILNEDTIMQPKYLLGDPVPFYQPLPYGPVMPYFL